MLQSQIHAIALCLMPIVGIVCVMALLWLQARIDDWKYSKPKNDPLVKIIK